MVPSPSLTGGTRSRGHIWTHRQLCSWELASELEWERCDMDQMHGQPLSSSSQEGPRASNSFVVPTWSSLGDVEILAVLRPALRAVGELKLFAMRTL